MKITQNYKVTSENFNADKTQARNIFYPKERDIKVVVVAVVHQK
jgi:hypothetical protein